ncbi:MAG: DUF1552 domain-containing protein [Polyangiaceae bacterium]|nr:DUF1552 domain-containing protein [Polyangiaceae bacterium]
MKRSSRRTFLQALGGSAFALPLVNMLADSVAQAEGENLPMKFVGMYHPHGVASEYWAMRDTDTETEFDIAYDGCSLSPFDDAATYGKSFKDKILLIEGIDLTSRAGGHESAGAILTGSKISGTPLNMSLDQYLAFEMGLGAETRLASASLGVGMAQTETGRTISFGAGGVPLPKIIDPVQAFDLFFAGFALGDDPEAEARAARQRALGKSVIDLINGDINRLNPKLAAREKLKLDQHLTSIRELEKQFQEPTLSAACSVPVPPDPSLFPSIAAFNGGEPFFPVITELMTDMLAQAMACDLTRFATVFLTDRSDSQDHAIAHQYSASAAGLMNSPDAGPGSPGSWASLAAINLYNYKQIARFMQKLDEFGILDSTLIYATSDMGNPAEHRTTNVPTLLAGGASGRFRMGRRLRMAQDCPDDVYRCDPSEPSAGGNFLSPTPQNKILVSIAQAFGAEIEAYGTQDDGSDQGTLDGLV